MLELKRHWINQPSKLQEFHKLHGMNVLAGDNATSSSVRVFFTSGDLSSQLIPRSVLAEGWKKSGEVELLAQLNRLKECSNCEVAPCEKCKECMYCSNPEIESTRLVDHWREARGEENEPIRN